MADFKNTYSWSFSRDGTFQDCKRRYWWNYYGYWNGWLSDAPEEARQAYMLKHLTNRWAWVGSVVHETIEISMGRVLNASRRQVPVPPVDLDVVQDQVTRRMRGEFGASRALGYRKKPKDFGLAEHEYAEDVSDEEWAAMNAKAITALRTFYTSDLYRELCESDASLWFPIDKLESFDFEGTKIWAALDFSTRRPDGGISIYDWKTGGMDAKASRPQLGCYTLYVGQAHGVSPDKVENHLIYLGDKLKDVAFRLEAEELEAIRAKMRASISEMRALIRDPDENIADRQDFPMTEDLWKCKTCSFRRLCKREN